MARIDSAWLTEFDRQHRRGRQILIYGNISDMFMYRGVKGFPSLAVVLDRYLLDDGYEVVAHYDMVDGFRFSSEHLAQRFDQMVVEGDGGSYRRGDEPLEEAAPGWYRSRRNEVQPAVALATARRLLVQRSVPLAVIVEFTDQLVDNNVQNDEERRLLVQLKKIARDLADQQGKDSRTGPEENRLVIAASHLAAVPRWLYLDEPLFGLVEIAKPTSPERKQFLDDTKDAFKVLQDGDTNQTGSLVDTLTTLTDGFTLVDIDSMGRASSVPGVPAMPPKRLVDYFKYGQTDDPWESLSPTRVEEAPKLLQRRVIGQPAAISAVVDMLISGRVGIDFSTDGGKAGRPKGSFFFVGPTGVGKTELAKALTELIFDDERAFARFDMSEYAQEHAAEKLAGAPPGFVGYDEGGQLTRRLKERPFSVLLFDEIEKAHPRVLDKFLQILEDGRLTDGKGETVYFSQAVVIFTSNVGSPREGEQGFDWANPPDYPDLRDHYIRATTDYFTNVLGRPELLSRLGDNVLVFDIIRPEYVKEICRKFLGMLAEATKDRRQLELRFPDDSIVDWIAQQMALEENLRMGGRRIRALLDGAVRHPFNRWLFFAKPQPEPESPLDISMNRDGRLEVNGETVAVVPL